MDLFIDIETHPDLRPGALQKYIDSVEPPGQYKKPESIAEWKAANAESVGKELWGRTALNPMAGGIYCIGYSLGGAKAATLTRLPDEPEGPFLTAALSSIIYEMDQPGQNRAPRFIGWNLIAFDLPFFAKRMAINGVSPALRMPFGARYNNDFLLDLMILWSGFREYAKQSDVAEAMGIKLADSTDGKDLWAKVEQEGVGAAACKCASDVDTLVAIHRRMAPVYRI